MLNFRGDTETEKHMKVEVDYDKNRPTSVCALVLQRKTKGHLSPFIIKVEKQPTLSVRYSSIFIVRTTL